LYIVDVVLLRRIGKEMVWSIPVSGLVSAGFASAGFASAAGACACATGTASTRASVKAVSILTEQSTRLAVAASFNFIFRLSKLVCDENTWVRCAALQGIFYSTDAQGQFPLNVFEESGSSGSVESVNDS